MRPARLQARTISSEGSASRTWSKAVSASSSASSRPSRRMSSSPRRRWNQDSSAGVPSSGRTSSRRTSASPCSRALTAASAARSKNACCCDSSSPGSSATSGTPRRWAMKRSDSGEGRLRPDSICEMKPLLSRPAASSDWERPRSWRSRLMRSPTGTSPASSAGGVSAAPCATIRDRSRSVAPDT